MTDWFVHGPLCHPAVRRVVLGRDIPGEAAVLPDHRVVARSGGAALPGHPGATAAGLLLRRLTADEDLRLAHYAGSLGMIAVVHAVFVGDARVVAQGWQGDMAPDATDAEWRLDAWTLHHAAEAVATAGDIMALLGLAEPAVIARRMGAMRVRGASRARAGVPGPVTHRWQAQAGDVAVAMQRLPYARFFAVEEYDLAYRRFDGTFSPVVTRAVFVSGDAVTVLPYDAVRDRVLVIEQFRAGPHARGDAQPWSLEAIAGRIDPGEGPEDCARREALEEAGLVLGDLLAVAQYYPSPGALSEYLYSYVALTDLPDGVAGVFGVEGEAEDIRGHLMGLDDLMDLVASGEVTNAPLILTALWLQRERGRLRVF